MAKRVVSQRQHQRLYGFDAGHLIDEDQEVMHLCARFHDFAITCEGALVVIDRPDEWPDGTFGSWAEVDLDGLDENAMGWLLSLVEHLIDFPRGLLGRDCLLPALLAYASGMTAAITQQGKSEPQPSNGLN